MKNIFKIFISDVKRIFQNVVAVVVIMGLCVIPCLYAWFNIFQTGIRMVKVRLQT